MGRTIALVVCLAVAFLLGWAQERTPAPLPANAPVTAFSAARAMADVEVIAKTPHPIGSPANVVVRDHLVARMTALGLSPQIQRAEVLRQEDGWIAGGTVENVIGVLPGRDRAVPAVAIMAHYDSVPGSPGAADDATGTAAALEIARAIKAKGQPARDIILLITDGEESGLLGAQAFFDQHPLAGRIGFLLNMEARGGGGRAQMFQTGADNAGTIELFRKSAVAPVASSLTVFLYEHMPNDTDFSVSKAKGIAGLNYAFIGSQFDYHMPASTPANLDKGSLQHIGEQVLAATTAAAEAKALPVKGPNLVYANTFGGHILAYPQAAGWIVVAVSGLLLTLAMLRARRAGALSFIDVLKGAGAGLFALTFAATIFRLARRASGAQFGFLEQSQLLAQAGRWETALALLGVGALLLAAAAAGRGRTRLAGAALALIAGGACSAFGHLDVIGLALGASAALLAVLSFGRPARPAGAWAGVLATGLLIAVALQYAAPTTAFLVGWPLVLACLTAVLTTLGARRSLPVLIALTIAGALGLSWLLAFGHGIYQGLDQPELLAVIVWLAALGLWPLAQPAEDQKGARMSALAVVLLGVVAVAVVRLDPPWTARHPQITHVAYYLNRDDGRAYRISDAPALPAWTRKVLGADGGAVEKLKLPGLRRDGVWAAPAAPVAAPPGGLEFTRQPDGAYRLHLDAPGARTLSLRLDAKTKLEDAALNGRPLKPLAGGSARIAWEAPTEGLTLTFRAPSPGAIEVKYSTVIDQWPAEAKPLPARPADLMASGTSGATIVGGARRFTW
ncbi:M20/M25/M40 family metallo-hydrolase [Phenylobacterium sp.]|uniref:M20/M25/M40 family metallo-hydrolase n=1 Tax=Phenylobacterium sp. TaxID=1871053 RepID=UPI0025DF3D74|nr:M20/M25/M40 family metallo-hydrolase [Phenylobacterium sp.]